MSGHKGNENPPPPALDGVIPAEATDAMVEAGLTTGTRFGPQAMRNIWRTMYAAALSSPAGDATPTAMPAQQGERECQAVWRCAIGDCVGAIDVLKNQMATSRKKADRRVAEVIAPVLDLVWAARGPAPSSYDEAAKAGSALIKRVRTALSATQTAQDQTNEVTHGQR